MIFSSFRLWLQKNIPSGPFERVEWTLNHLQIEKEKILSMIFKSYLYTDKIAYLKWKNLNIEMSSQERRKVIEVFIHTLVQPPVISWHVRLYYM